MENEVNWLKTNSSFGYCNDSDEPNNRKCLEQLNINQWQRNYSLLFVNLILGFSNLNYHDMEQIIFLSLSR
jgi:hypothetical protein